jgi:DNA-binding beta-propeller fold protein YncE
MKALRHRVVLGMTLLSLIVPVASCVPEGTGASTPKERRLLYVAVDGGIDVFEIDEGHRFLKKIELEGVTDPKGICAHAVSRRLFVTHANHLLSIDLATDKIVWDRTYDSGCDRMSATPDGSVLYVPSGFWTKTPYWYVVRADTGEEVARVSVREGTHNTLAGRDGTRMYLSSLRHNYLAIVDTRTHQVIREVGPFSHPVRPFTVNRDETLCFANVDHLLGFEVGDLRTGKVLHRVEVAGYTSAQGKPARHRCPSHGIGLTPDGKELWVVDGLNKMVHLFDTTVLPPRQIASVSLSDEPYWITFSIDGRYAYPSTGDVVETGTRKPVLRLLDERRKPIDGEKVIEIDFSEGVPIRVGDQFGVVRG